MPTRTHEKQTQARRSPAPAAHAGRQSAGPVLAPPPVLRLAVDRPAVASPAALVALQQRYGNRAVQRLVDPTGTLQRFFGFGKAVTGLASKAKLNKVTRPKPGMQPGEHSPEATQEPENKPPAPPAKTLLMLRIMVAPPADTLKAGRLSEFLRGVTGHSWLELSLGSDYPSLEALEAAPEGGSVTGALEGSTESALESGGVTSLAFYPTADDMPIPRIFRRLFAGFPGELQEPESSSFTAKGQAMATFGITDPGKAVQVLRYVRAARKHAYSLVKFNSMDFVLGAARAAGMPTPGRPSENPKLLYRRVYHKMLAAARSGELRELSLVAPEGERPPESDETQVTDPYANIREGSYRVVFPAGLRLEYFPSEVRQSRSFRVFDQDTACQVLVNSKLKTAGRARVTLPDKVVYVRLRRLFAEKGNLRNLRPGAVKAKARQASRVGQPTEEDGLLGNLFD